MIEHEGRREPGDIGIGLAYRPRVLVVDDDPVNLLVAGAMLARCGVDPLLAGDGAEAVALACELHLDLILMDLQMPVLDGYQATAQIRQFEDRHARPRVPIVAYTSTAAHASRLLLREIGIDAVLHKPCDMQTLGACVKRWCSPVRAAPAGAADTRRSESVSPSFGRVRPARRR